MAALIELARSLRDARPRRRSRLVAFVNEEPPFFWSERWEASSMRRRAARGDDIRIMLSLEMLGYYRDERGTQKYPPMVRWFYPDRGDFVAFVSNLRSRSRAARGGSRAFATQCRFPARAPRQSRPSCRACLERSRLVLARRLSRGVW